MKQIKDKKINGLWSLLTALIAFVFFTLSFLAGMLDLPKFSSVFGAAGFPIMVIAIFWQFFEAGTRNPAKKKMQNKPKIIKTNDIIFR